MEIQIPDRTINERPKYNNPVLAIVQGFHTKKKRYAILIAVDESDCNWRTEDDNSELSFDWDVIAWEYLQELK